jgi:hypothetical protein
VKLLRSQVAFENQTWQWGIPWKNINGGFSVAMTKCPATLLGYPKAEAPQMAHL